MSEASDRPDPDALLRRVQREETRAQRGKLRLFFGFAPGVGKTYRMLQVARDLVIEQQLDVVVGIAETHRRQETAVLLLGLELLPRRQIAYRGRVLEEFDLDAALARKPQVIVVDELAHTNVPGSRHPKRWQDVEELLAAGIDVLTTMNVQHVESLNDVIAQISRIQVRETVPDSVLDAADAIELIDIAPEELLQRLKEGKVYLPEQAQRAAEHFFQRGNLLALRELALRRTAQHVDEDVREYREAHGVAATWPAGERILVCVGPAPSSGRLIRAAARMAAGLRCPWVASYVELATLDSMSDVDRERLEVHLRVAESLGAAVVRLSGVSVSEALLAYARKHNVTRLIIGKPTHSRLRDRLRGSLLDEVVRGSGDIDVHVISGDNLGEAPVRGGGPIATRARPAHYAAAVGIVGATLGLAMLLRAVLGLPDLEMLFLLAVMATAARFGRGPALLAAGLGVACYDFFFVLPLHTLSVADRRYFLSFAMMFGVGILISELAGRLRRQERDALGREERTAGLYALTKELASTEERSEVAAIAARHAGDSFGARAVVLSLGPAGALELVGNSPPEASLDTKDLGVAQWAFEHDQLSGCGTDTLPGSQALCAPLRVGHARLGVLALVAAEPAVLSVDQRAFLEVFCRHVAVALERSRLAEEARRAAVHDKAEEMRSSLLSAVSHDLRTPLASITGAATALRDETRLDAATKGELVDAIVEQAERLERLVGNLLDMTRLESGALQLKRDWVPLEELVGSALTRLETRLEARRVRVVIPADLPLLFVDPVLWEQLFVNLLENADKYTPPGSPLEIVARRDGDRVAIEVIDHGPGLPPGSEQELFEKFVRGPHRGVAGAGLGLSICRGIAEAHGGTIRAENHPDGGAVFRIVVPTGGEAPSLRGPGEDRPAEEQV
ncbi:MAG: sensor histidine kinase KdpD [Proteobacteria bacterium]|nr:sensor histidine kinase KdpD [Pseudomonadota bacterium]